MERANKMYYAKSPRKSSKSSFRWRNLSCIRIVAVAALVPFICCVFSLWNRLTVDNPESPLAASSPSTLDVLVYDDTSAELDQLLVTSAEHIKAGRYKEADHVLSAMLERNPDGLMKAVIYYNRGLCNFYLGNYYEAIEDFEFSTNSRPFAEAYYSLGLAYVALDPDGGYIQKAITAYSNAIEQDPENVNYRLVRASAYEVVEQNLDAREDYRAVLKLDPENSHARARLDLLESME